MPNEILLRKAAIFLSANRHLKMAICFRGAKMSPSNEEVCASIQAPMRLQIPRVLGGLALNFGLKFVPETGQKLGTNPDTPYAVDCSPYDIDFTAENVDFKVGVHLTRR